MSSSNTARIRTIVALILLGLLSACGAGGGEGGGLGGVSLSATARSATSIQLSWSEPGGGVSVSPYVVARVYDDRTHRIASTTEREYLVAGLQPVTRYCYVIRAPLTSLAISNTACATTLEDRRPPTRPEGVSATAVSSRSIDVHWNASRDEVGVDGYRVFRDGVELMTVEPTRLEDTGLMPDTRYCYRVSAFDTSGNESTQSPEACATTRPDAEAPSVPGDVRVSSALAGGISTLTVRWSASSDDSAIAGYTVLRDGIALADTAETYLDDADLAPNVTYCYQVIARDIVGKESAPSEAVCAIESWRKESLGEVGVGAGVIAVDAGNVPVLAWKQLFYDDSRGEYRATLKVGRIDGGLAGELLDDSVAEAYVWGEYAMDMQIPADGRLHIVHQARARPGASALRYLVRSASVTEETTLASDVEPLYGASIAVDSRGVVHGCFDYDNTLYYGTNESGGWILTDLAALVEGANGSDCRIAIGADDALHLVYLERRTHDVRYAGYDGVGWSGQLVDRQSGTSTNTIYHTAIAIAPDGAVHLAYAHDLASNNMEYATNASGSWVTETVDDAGTVGYGGAIAVDSAGRPYIVYEELDGGRRIRFATRENGRWETVVLSSSSTGFLSMTVDALDQLHLAFTAEGGELAYMQYRR